MSFVWSFCFMRNMAIDENRFDTVVMEVGKFLLIIAPVRSKGKRHPKDLSFLTNYW